MRILMIDDFGYKIGGAEVYMFGLASALRKQGNQVSVMSSDKKGARAADFTYSSIVEDSPLRFIRYVFNVSAYRRLRKLVTDYKPDIVHIHSFYYHTSPSVLFALQSTNCVITLHSNDLIAPFGHSLTKKCKHSDIDYCRFCVGIARYQAERLKHSILKAGLKNVTMLIAPSEYIKNTYLEHGFKSPKIIHLVNGFDFAEMKDPLPRKRSGLVFVGRIVKEKGLEVVLRALPIVIRNNPKTILRVIGEGSELKSMRSLVKELRIEQNVKFLGYIENKSIFRHLLSAEALILPSLWKENLPTVCLEALHAGTPIIASDVGGVPEIVSHGKSGFLFRAGHSNELATCISELLNDRKLSEMFSKNALVKSRKYEMAKHVKKVQVLYTEILNTKAQ